MSDDFNDWQKLWNEKQAPLPDIAKLARRQHRGLLAANLFFWPTTAAELYVAVAALTHYPEPRALSTGLVMLTAVAILSTFFFRMQRGLWREALETPPQTLKRLERHQRSMRPAAWVGALTFLGISVFVFAQALLETSIRRERLGLPLGLLVAAVATVVLWPRFIGKHADRLEAQIATFRQQLDL